MLIPTVAYTYIQSAHMLLPIQGLESILLDPMPITSLFQASSPYLTYSSILGQKPTFFVFQSKFISYFYSRPKAYFPYILSLKLIFHLLQAQSPFLFRFSPELIFFLFEPRANFNLYFTSDVHLPYILISQLIFHLLWAQSSFLFIWTLELISFLFEHRALSFSFFFYFKPRAHFPCILNLKLTFHLLWTQSPFLFILSLEVICFIFENKAYFYFSFRAKAQFLTF